MADTREADPRRKKPAKKGLHGWKAAAAMFGCGTLAAFAVFGVIVGILSLVLGAVSGGVSSEGRPVPVADQSVKPREEFLDDKFDLCGRTLRTISDLSLVYENGTGEYEDSSIDGGEPGDDNLVRTDRCSGEVVPTGAYTAPWSFEFSYRAIIFSPEDNRDEIAESDLSVLRSEFEESGVEIADSGAGDLGDESYYYYGALDDNQEASYTLFVRQRSATYVIQVTSVDDVSREAFAGEVRKFGPQLRITLVNRIPK